MSFSRVRWGDNDYYFGPFTWSPRNAYSATSIVLSSGGDDDDQTAQCNLRMSFAGYTLIVVLPPFVRPHKEKIAGKKGDRLEDLKKARFYLDREIANLTSPE